jgi:nitrogen fixation NifU-like protein
VTNQEDAVTRSGTPNAPNPLTDPDGYGKNTGTCGDTVEMFLSVKDQRIAKVSFRIDGCSNTLACASAVARFAEGRTLREAWEITVGQVITHVGNLPPEFEHCAEVAVGALYLALVNAQEIRQSPWKKMYRKP